VPIILFFAILFAALCAAVLLAPLGLIQRYRAGTRRRRARRWIAGINVTGLLISVALFLLGGLISNRWVPDAFTRSVGGLAGGSLLGLLGLRLTRWEEVAGTLNYTPNRTLVLLITLVVTGRLAYGIWRMWRGWSVAGSGGVWLENSGIPGSLAATGVVLGYSFTYWIGMLRKVQQTQ
jgi:hypothetical protein